MPQPFTITPASVLFEDNHLLILNKPAGIATMGTPQEKITLLDIAKKYIKQKYSKPGNVYLGVVSRLDAPTTGVLPFARTSKAAARLTEQFRERTTEKRYLALIEGHLDAPQWVRLTHWLGEDARHRKMHVVPQSKEGAKKAELEYRTHSIVGGNTLVEVRLLTGRKHQIRVQFAEKNLLILGDRKYGSQVRWPAGIALHCWQLTLEHPVKREPLTLVAPPPKGMGQPSVD